MDQRPRGRKPYARRVWPPTPEPEEALPPSARVYGTPAAPARPRIPRRLRTALVVSLAGATGVAVIAAAVAFVMSLTAPRAPSEKVVDGLAGIRYPLPLGWRPGGLAPVTAFSSVVTNGDATAVGIADGGQAMLMARTGPDQGARPLREITLELAELYAGLLLHGDTVDVVHDGPVSVAGYPGHSRSVLAGYDDVVNRPAYLRVVVLDRGPRTVVLLGLAQPDDQRARADIDAIVRGVSR
ncbi:hypothetical protein Misp01_01770 [Microtetraspora sp. NBRC 13810]|uniref:hypothetical protein n=1 Tax=Microtetraspora sp. NBRC 13810 TaxID=3030990 RepID=UPI0024A23469|nr:hypothetical protein [Microtetraspora sp. NBRC 13810]GLW05047.1 hypothetical protein Misp01_01770 [Microtetraspora sp. NBRC 13810]